MGNKTSWGVLTLRILDALETVGPMTCSDLKDHLDLEREPGGSVLYRMGKPTKTMPKRVYISDWRRSQDGQRDYLRPVFAAGNKPDKPRPPKKSRAEISRDYNQRVQRKARCVVPGISQKKARSLVARMGVKAPEQSLPPSP